MEKKLKKALDRISSNSNSEFCLIKDVISVVNDKWSIFIILFLGGYKVLRFNELKKKVSGISSKVLSNRLKKMERDGYIERSVYFEVPLRVDYTLTDFGKRYLEQLLGVNEWINKELHVIIENRKKYDKAKLNN